MNYKSIVINHQTKLFYRPLQQWHETKKHSYIPHTTLPPWVTKPSSLTFTLKEICGSSVSSLQSNCCYKQWLNFWWTLILLHVHEITTNITDTITYQQNHNCYHLQKLPWVVIKRNQIPYCHSLNTFKVAIIITMMGQNKTTWCYVPQWLFPLLWLLVVYTLETGGSS